MQWTGKAAKVRIYVNTNRRTMQQIKAETGCDVIINGGLYDMNTYRPVCHLKVDGKVLSQDQYTYLGYGWSGDETPRLVTDYSSMDNYICCVCLVREGAKAPLYYDKSVGGARERTAIGTMHDGSLWVYVGSNPQTPEALQETAVMAGVRDAIMLDGGASTQGILPGYTTTSKRNVHNYICIWEEKEDSGMDIIQIPSNAGNYGGKRKVGDIKYIVLHYTGNNGDSARANGLYFQRTVVQASAHYFVDSKEIVQSVHDDYIAWHCGAKIYYHPNARNANSIGVELCDDNKDGEIYPSAATIDRALALVKQLMDKYGVPQENVIRHWDVSHKLCPAYWSGTSAKDALWRSAFWSRLAEEKKPDSTPAPDRYNTMAEIERDAPWAAPTVAKLLYHQSILGDGTGLDLSRDMLRLLVICDREGCFGDQ